MKSEVENCKLKIANYKLKVENRKPGAKGKEPNAESLSEKMGGSSNEVNDDRGSARCC